MADTKLMGFDTPEGAVDYHTENVYKFLSDAYTGRGGFSGNVEENTYMVHSRSESSKNFNERVQTSYYKNFLEPFTTAQYKPVYVEQPPVINALGTDGEPLKTSPFVDWSEDVTGAGISLNDFFETSTAVSYLNNVSFLVMDKSEEHLEPIMYMQDAQSVDKTKLEVDRFGVLKQIAFITVYKTSELGTKTYLRTTWTDSDVTLEYSEDENDPKEWNKKEVKPLKIKKMPVYAMFSVNRIDPLNYLPFPTSSMKVATINAVLFNTMSERLWHTRRQGLATMWTDADLERVSDGYSEVVKLDTERGDSGASIGFVNADTGIAKNHQDLERDVIKDITTVMAQEGVIVVNDEVPESGVARAYRYKGLQTKMNNTVKMYRRALKWTANMYKQYQDPSGTWTANVELKTDYEVKEALSVDDTTTAINTFNAFGTLEGVKAGLESLAHRLVKDDGAYKVIQDNIDTLNLPNEVVE